MPLHWQCVNPRAHYEGHDYSSGVHEEHGGGPPGLFTLREEVPPVRSHESCCSCSSYFFSLLLLLLPLVDFSCPRGYSSYQLHYLSFFLISDSKSATKISLCTARPRSRTSRPEISSRWANADHCRKRLDSMLLSTYLQQTSR